MIVALLAVVEEAERAMKLYDFLQFSVCVFSILAAGFWLQSAATTLPKLTKNLNWDGTGPFPEALKSQSHSRGPSTPHPIRKSAGTSSGRTRGWANRPGLSLSPTKRA